MTIIPTNIDLISYLKSLENRIESLERADKINIFNYAYSEYYTPEATYNITTVSQDLPYFNVEIETTGGPVLVMGSVRTIALSGGNWVIVSVSIDNGADNQVICTNNVDGPAPFFHIFENLNPGSHIIKVSAFTTVGTASIIAGWRERVVALELNTR